MKTRFFSSLCLALSLPCLVALEPARGDSETRTTVRRTSVLVGSTLRLEGGTTYGKVEDFVLTDAGCVEYLVVTVDDGYVAVPWAAATVDFEQRTINVNVTRERLQELRFQKSEWANVSAAAYRDRVHRVFGAKSNRDTRPAREGEAKTPSRETPPRADQPNTQPKKDEAPRQPNTPKADEPKQPTEAPPAQPKKEETPRQPKAEEPRRPVEQPLPQPKREEAPRPR